MHLSLGKDNFKIAYLHIAFVSEVFNSKNVYIWRKNNNTPIFIYVKLIILNLQTDLGQLIHVMINCVIGNLSCQVENGQYWSSLAL